MPPRILVLSALLAFLALPAWADAAGEAICANRGSRLPAEQVMTACNALVADTHQRDSNRARAFAWRGLAEARADKHDAAMADFTQALALDEDNFEAAYGRGQLHYQAKEYAAALEDFGHALKLQPNATQIYLLRSTLYLDLRRYPEAIADADYERGGGAAFLNARCWSRAVAGIELDKARLACDQGLWAQPDFPPILDSRGLVGLKQKNFQAAWNDFNAVLKAAPRNVRGLYGRGLAAIGLGREAEGRADIATAKSLNGNIATLYADVGIPAPQ